jgi:hypothetical protein
MKKLLFIQLFFIISYYCKAQDSKTLIGKPIKIGNILVAQQNFQKEMDWGTAMQACNTLGDGWRLPTQTELDILYKNKHRISGFIDGGYWSSTEYVNINNNDYAYCQSISTGYQTTCDKKGNLYVRAVKILSSLSVNDIIGEPIKIGNLSVAQYDFTDVMDWRNAMQACNALGNGWRLPTKSELYILYKNKNNIKGFLNDAFYWSSTEDDNCCAWFQNFSGWSKIDMKMVTMHVRAVNSNASLVTPIKKTVTNIIGNPINIGNLSVAQYGFPDKMYWEEAKEACNTLGNGWRLPTKEELMYLFKNKNKIKGFADGFYWSSTEYYREGAWKININFGVQNVGTKQEKAGCWAVRTFNN